MKRFTDKQIFDAFSYAAKGEQALFTHEWQGSGSAARPFKQAGMIGKLFDQDKERLIKTAKRLGVRIIKVDHEGTFRQHIDLAAGPLKRAIQEAEQLSVEDFI